MRQAMRTLGPPVAGALLLGFFFAHVEIAIEGAAGWAANLPTWRIEKHWLLDVFWGGRPMTGYHAWMFPFIALVFHYRFCFGQPWSWRAESMTAACLMIFWITEDALWFGLNPAWGWARFHAGAVPWHPHWLFGVPVDYVMFSVLAVLLLRASLPKQ